LKRPGISARFRGNRRQSFLKLHTGERGDGALLDHKFRRACLGGDLASDVVDGGKVGLAGFFRRVPTQMKMTSPARIASQR